jgi:hypothetical protein
MRRHASRITLRQAAVLVTATAVGLALTAGGPVSARPATPGAVPADATAQYEVYDVRTTAQRNVIASTGAAIDDVEHAVVTVTATAREVRTRPARPPWTSRHATPRTTTTRSRTPRSPRLWRSTRR